MSTEHPHSPSPSFLFVFSPSVNCVSLSELFLHISTDFSHSSLLCHIDIGSSRAENSIMRAVHVATTFYSQCGVLLRPNQSMMDRIITASAALKTAFYRTSVIISRGKKSGHYPWQQDHQKAMDAKRGALKRGKYTFLLDRWQNDEVYRAFQLVHGLTDEWVKYLDCITKIDISHDAPHRQRQQDESTVYMRGVDSNKQAGPLCQRPGYKSSANALVSLQRAQGKGVPQIPMHLRTRQNNTWDPAVQQPLECLSFKWKTSSSSSSTWTESPAWWSSSSWDNQWQEWHSQGWPDKEWRDQR